MPKRIAILGSGISGSLCARLLATQHEVTLYEAAAVVGGHTHTVDVEVFGRTWPVDTGFMVFNDRTYPNFIKMLDLLGVDSQPSDMSFSVHCRRTGLEYQGSSLNGLFAQRTNMLRPSFWKMLIGIKKFNTLVQELVGKVDASLSLGEWIARCNDDRAKSECIDQQVIDHYLLPMTAAIWSAPPQAMMDFPIAFLANFLQNHGLLQVFDRPQWRTIPGGAKRYLDALLHPLGSAVRTNSPVTSVARTSEGVLVAGNEAELFDAVVFASHAPQALAMLVEPTPLEKDVLSAFRYQRNTAVLHTDRMLLPYHRRAWASWNYRLAADSSLPATVTYDLSRLQHHVTPTPILQTLNPAEPIDSTKTLQSLEFEHPLYDQHTYASQEKHDLLHTDGKLFYCGAYWGYGFHEDGVNSALRVCQQFGINLDHLNSPCKVASTKVESST